MILYVETKFLMGAATGREAGVDGLLALPRSALRLILPAICVMEAWSAFEDERKRRNAFRQALDTQISQLLRDRTSVHAAALSRHLQRAQVENSDVLDDIRVRLRDVQEKMAGRREGFPAADLLPLTTAVLAQDFTTGPTGDPTDNLILAIILEHARRNPNETRVFLSGNTRDFGTTEIRALLLDAGITEYFARTEAFLGWLQARSQPH